MLSNYYDIKSDLLDANDGRVTKYVLLIHALQLASKNIHSIDDIAEVLDECLENFEEIPSTEFPKLFF